MSCYNWHTDWLPKQLTDQLTDWIHDWLTEWQIGHFYNIIDIYIPLLMPKVSSRTPAYVTWEQSGVTKSTPIWKLENDLCYTLLSFQWAKEKGEQSCGKVTFLDKI